MQARNDSILVYQLGSDGDDRAADSAFIAFPREKYNEKELAITCHEPHLDLDFLTIPFKFRPPAGSLPAQLNSDLNGAVFLGFRNDIYRMRYERTPLNYYQRVVRHYGVSVGLFTGLGPTSLNAWVTNFSLGTEYDGVWSKGMAGIMAIGKFTLGLCIGFDNLLNDHSTIWIYESKPWLGLAFGLNLN